MFKWAYRIADGEFLHGGPCEVQALAGQAVVAVPRNPKVRVERWDESNQRIRPATTGEIAAYDQAVSDEREHGELDTQLMIRAVAIFLAQRLGIPLAEARQEILTIRRSLRP